jgi:FMN phosphatase YigB (HAD superfamily)
VSKITTLFFDIGGVILTNGWDRGSRRKASDAFHLDYEEFQDRHDLTFPAFDAGHITLDEYLDRTLFYRKRTFTREEFITFMYAQSVELPGTRAILDALAQSGKYFMSTINNEPFELNEYRIQKFELRLFQFVLRAPPQAGRADFPGRFARYPAARGPVRLRRRPPHEPGKSPAVGNECDSLSGCIATSH